MTLHREIVDFLMTVNGMDSPSGRQSILTYLGYGHLSNLLNYQGANFDFANQLVTVLENRGTSDLRQFLVDLQTAPQVSVDGRAKLEGLVARLDADDDAVGGAAAAGQAGTEAWKSMTKLNGKQFGAFQDALVAAFDPDTLRTMVTRELDEDLATITGSGNKKTMAFELISWAQRSGRLPDLIQGALNAEPKNPDLKDFVASLG